MKTWFPYLIRIILRSLKCWDHFQTLPCTKLQSPHSRVVRIRPDSWLGNSVIAPPCLWLQILHKIKRLYFKLYLIQHLSLKWYHVTLFLNCLNICILYICILYICIYIYLFIYSISDHRCLDISNRAMINIYGPYGSPWPSTVSSPPRQLFCPQALWLATG